MISLKKKYQDFVDCEIIGEQLCASFFDRKPIARGKVMNRITFNEELFIVNGYADDKIEVVNDVASYMRGNKTLVEWNGSALTVYDNTVTEIVQGLYFFQPGKLEIEFMPVLFPGGFRPTCCGGFLNKYPLILDTKTGDVNYNIEKYVEKFLAAKKPNDHYFEVIQKYISKVPENLHHKIAKKAFKFALAS